MSLMRVSKPISKVLVRVKGREARQIDLADTLRKRKLHINLDINLKRQVPHMQVAIITTIIVLYKMPSTSYVGSG